VRGKRRVRGKLEGENSERGVREVRVEKNEGERGVRGMGSERKREGSKKGLRGKRQRSERGVKILFSSLVVRRPPTNAKDHEFETC